MKRIHGIRGMFVAAFIVFVSISSAFGQSAGAILGTVVDTSGALIPGVEVTVTNQGTNQTRQAITNETGSYRIEPLQVGVYSVSAELAGFRKEIRREIKVDVDAHLRIDFRLEIGSVSEAVEVIGSAPLVQTADSQVGQVVDQVKIMELPLNGRNFSSLTFIAPGAFAPRANSRLADRGGFMVTGGDEETNEYLIDGVNANGAVTLELVARVNMDAIGEFKIQTQNYNAQYGRFGGGHVDAAIKSGTNQFHGTAFLYVRNAALDARNFFDPGKLPPFHRYQYGATVGGPIMHDKAFFFVGFQGQRQAQFITTKPTILLPEFWDGNLSRLNKTIRDPLTGQPFPNSRIPKERISPVSLKFRPYFDRATLVNNNLARNSTALLNSPENFWSPNVKINYNLTPNHQIVGSHLFYGSDLNEWNYAGNPELPGFMIATQLRNHHIALQDVLTLSSTMVNEFRIGLGRIWRERLNETDDTYIKPGIDYARQVFGLPQTSASFDQRCWRIIPQVIITGYSQMGQSSGNCNPSWVHGNFSMSDILSVQKGNHALKFGGDLFHQLRLKTVALENGSYTFTGACSGDATADFLLGCINVATNRIPFGGIAPYIRRWSTDWFVADDWKVSPNLTLNIGLRYELNFPIVEQHGQFGYFDPSIDGGKGGLRIMSNTEKYYPDAIAFYKRLYPSLVFATTDKRTALNLRDFAPRFGFAYTPRGRTSTAIRGGYGVFYTIYSLNPYSGIPLNLSQRFTRADNPTWANPFPGVGASGTIPATGWEYNMRDAYLQQWNLGIQQQVPLGVVVDAAYVGKKGARIQDSSGHMTRDINQSINGVRPYRLFGQINQSFGASTIYHGLQLRVERRSTTGVAMLFAYSWGQLIGDVTAVGADVRDSYNTRAERGPERDDLRHRMSTSLILPLPIGHGRTYFNQAGSLANALFGNWNLTAIIRANSGSQLTPTVTGDFSGTARLRDRPDMIGNPNWDKKDPTKGWWDSAAFVLPARGTFGNAGKGILRGPGYFSSDFSIQKKFSVSENQKFELRWELFNAFNQSNFYDPSTVFGSPNFGTIGSALPGRQMQGAVRYNF